MKKDYLGCIGLIIAIIVLMIFGGAIGFGLGYLGGVFLKWICGTPVANGLNMVLGNITQYHFTPDDIPLFSAILTMIAGFFNNKNYGKTNN